MPSVEPTELTDIKVVRQDGVKSPASGFPFLIMKSAAAKAVNAVGGIDEKPDIAGANRILQELGKLIAAEADEMTVGADELYDIRTLVEAACLISCFRDNEMWGDEDDGSELAKAAQSVIKRKIGSDERKKLASEGKALPDGSYPIENAEDLHNAAVLARSGHGDVAAAKRLIAKRAKELGVANPLAEDAKKEADAGTDLPGVRDAGEVVPVPEGEDAAVKDGEVETSGDVTPDGDDARKDAVAKQVADAVAEATRADRERIEALAAEVAKMKATPIPGGPMLTATADQRATKVVSELLSKAAYHERLAGKVQDRELAKYHREQAAAAKAAAVA